MSDGVCALLLGTAGSVNYVAVSEALSLSPSARMAGLAADDLVSPGCYSLVSSWPDHFRDQCRHVELGCRRLSEAGGG